jgi:hypothetical protein
MSLLVTLYVAVLFFLLTPAILVSLPPKGGKFTVAAVHALVFALIFHFTHKIVWRFGVSLEGMADTTTEPTIAHTTTESKKKMY